MATRSVMVSRVANVQPGELAAFDIDGIRVAVANVEGRLFAIDELCTHEHCSLVEEGTLEGPVVTCGCQGAQFDVRTGEVLAAPAVEPLRAYPVHLDRDEIVVEV
jgi:nitrite reductase/ring-hydroxylating ferredoxin subunit